MRSKKAVPAKNSEANFWRPRFTRPLRAGKRANATFACSEGFFCARRAAPSAGAAAFSKPAAVWPVGFCARCLGVFSAGAPLPCPRLAGSLLLLCLAWSGLRCRGLLAVCPPCACVCGAFAAAVWPVWLAAPGCREVPPPGGCACALPQVGPRPAAVFPAFVFCRFCADFCTCCLFVRRALCVCAHFSLIFRLFLPNFFLSKFFSLVAHAATGLLFFSSLCGVVFRPACSLPSLRRLPPLWRLLCQVSVCLPCGFVCALFVCLLPFST